MQKPLIKLFIVLMALSFVSACATTHGTQKQVNAKPQTKIQKQISTIMVASASDEMLFIEVPSPNNLISEKIMIASLTAGGSSTAIDQLRDILSAGKSSAVGVTGKSHEINAITVKRTLEQLKDKPASGTVYLIADAKTQESLKVLNQNTDIKLVFVE